MIAAALPAAGYLKFTFFPAIEGDYVTAIGSWRGNGAMQGDWVQNLRIEQGKNGETWLPALATEGKGTADYIPV